MEGKIQQKRLSKKRFFMKNPDLETQVSTDLPSQSEDSFKHSILSQVNSEKEDYRDIEKLTFIPLSQVSTQPDLNSDMIIYHAEILENSAERVKITFEKEIERSDKKNGKKLIRKAKNDIFESFKDKNIYTQEESEDEEKVQKKKKVNDIESELKNSNIYTIEESDKESNQETPNTIKDKKKSLGKNTKIFKLDENSINSSKKEENSENESENELILLPKKRKSSYKKVANVPLKTFNKLVEIKQDTFFESGAPKEIVSDEEISINPVQKSINNSFLDKIKLNKSDKFNFTLAKSILTEKHSDDPLQVSAPTKLEGFMLKKLTKDPRDLLRESLKSEINQRKTVHIGHDSIFSKTVSDLCGKQKKNEEESESEDYVPEDNEESEALEMEKIIKLEEGEEIKECESIGSPQEVSEDSESENQVLDEKVPEKDVEMQEENGKNEDRTPVEEISNENPMEIDSSSEECEESSSESESKSSKNDEKVQEKPGPSLITTTDNSPALLQLFSSKVKVSKFMENEAEVGSDHEEHDDYIKNYKDSDFEDDENDNKDLEELLDRENIEDDEEIRLNKHLNQLIEEDQNQINKVINAEFRRQRKDMDFIDASSNILSKKQKLLDDKKKLIAMRENPIFSKDLESVAENQEMDDEEFDKFQVLRGSQQLKFIRNQFTSKSVIDDKSLSYLSLITKPEKSYSSKSLLNESEKSKGMQVFRTSENLSSNRSFVFSKNKSKTDSVSNQIPKKTKLYKLLSQ